MTLSPEEADRLFDEIVNSFELGNHKNAMLLAVSALDKGLDEPLVLLLAAEAFEEQGRGLEGVELIRKASDIAPDEAQVWYCLGTMLIRQGLEEDGLFELKKALSLQADLMPALKNAATTSYRLGQLTDAETYYKRIHIVEPNNPECLAALAAIAARRGNSGEARVLASQALSLQSTNVTAEMALGRAEFIDKQFRLVCERMDRLLQRADLDDDSKVAIFDLRADAYDLLDLPDAAFSDYQSRNAILIHKFAPRIKQQVTERYVARARRLAKTLSTQTPETWKTHADNDENSQQLGNRLVFLLSFPRSGTTLLEKILRSHSQILTLEEVDLLSDIASEWLDSTDGIEILKELSPEHAAYHRERYWRRVRETIGNKLNGKTLIDKLPLHTFSLPVIAKLFPKAKILFALRDPRDVVLSCFRRRFQINPAMFELLDLQNAARFYNEVMSLAEIARDILPIQLHEVKHEHTVQRFDQTISSVLDFIDVPWEHGLKAFSQNLPADPRTPSDLQLKRGLNADGLAQWKRYSAHMEPVMDLLEPWQVRFGYD